MAGLSDFARETLWRGLLPLCFLTFLVTLIAHVFSYIRTGIFSELRQFPGPFLANFSDAYLLNEVTSGNCHVLFNRLHAKYGPIVRTGPNKLSIAHPDAIPIIYGANSRFLKSAFYEAFRRNLHGRLMDNIFTTRDPQYHRKMKSSVASVYSLSSLRQMENLIDENTTVFINSMESQHGQPIDLSDWLQWYAFDVIGSITFSQTFGFMDAQRDVNDVIQGLDAAFKYASVIGMMPKLHPWLLGSQCSAKLLSRFPSLARANQGPVIGRMAVKAMKEYDARSEEERSASGDLLSAFRQAQAKHPDSITERDLMGFVFANLFAGSDTTAIALRSIFYYLVQYPEKYRILTDEIQQADEAGLLSSTITYHEGLNLRYLQAVIKESLRLHPGISLPLDRVVPLEGADICGVFIPGGTTVGVSAWVVHQDKRVYGKDAEEFRPERWLEADPEQLKLMDRAFLAFGGGTRSCIGRNISILEMTKFVPQVLRKFKLEWASSEKEWAVQGYFMAKQQGMIMRLVPNKTGE